MKYYDVSYDSIVKVRVYLEVEADSEEGAIEKAKSYEYISYDEQFSETIDDTNYVATFSYEEEEED